MRSKTPILAAVLAATCLAALALPAAAAPPDKVDICHFAGGDLEKARLMSVPERVAPRHFAHGDFIDLGMNTTGINGVGCHFCYAPQACDVFCVGTPPCLCPPDDAACCDANPCCDPCPGPKPPECSLIFCGCAPGDCCVTVCSG